MGTTDRPDPYSNEWYRVQMLGQDQRANRLEVELHEAKKQILKLLQRIEDLERHRMADMAEIGGIKARLDTAAQVVAKMKRAPEVKA